ncbi:MAG: hypothetical protein ACE14U_02725 [Candidatus Velamenicoccus archaeovorus]
MNGKLVENIANNMRPKDTRELLDLYVENDREQYSEEAFEAIRQLLRERGQSVPAQKETALPKEEAAVSAAEIEKSVKISRNTLLIWGCIGTALWFFAGAEDRRIITVHFEPLRPLLWFLVYGGLVIGLIMLALGISAFFIKKTKTLLLTGLMLMMIGILNIGYPFLISWALGEYGHDVDPAAIIFDAGNKFWIFLGLLQMGWGVTNVEMYLKIRRHAAADRVSSIR